MMPYTIKHKDDEERKAAIALRQRQYAIYRHVWKLTSTEAHLLHRLFLIKTRADVLLAKLDNYYEEHSNIRDYIIHNNEAFECEYSQTSYMEIDELCSRQKLGATIFLISCRVISGNDTKIALIRKQFPDEPIDTLPWIDNDDERHKS